MRGCLAFALAHALPSGSLCGGTDLTVEPPKNFTCPHDAVRVRTGPAPCEVHATELGPLERVKCTTGPLEAGDSATVPIFISCDKRSDPVQSPTPGPKPEEHQVGSFLYDAGATAVIEEAGPSAGLTGDVVHLLGSKLQDATVEFGQGHPGTVHGGGGPSMVQAIVPVLPAGDWQIKVRTSTGYACPGERASLRFQALLSVQSAGPGAGSFGGGGELSVVGLGLDQASEVTLCGKPCVGKRVETEPPLLHAGQDFTALHCRPTAYADVKAPAVSCALAVVAGGQTVVIPDAWRYDPELTPVVRSVSAGKQVPKMHAAPDLVTINGEGLDPVRKVGLLRKGGGVSVTIGGKPCEVARAAEDFIECHGAHLEGDVVVRVEGKGIALMPKAAAALAPPTPPPQEPALAMHAYASTLCKKEGTECPPGWSCCPVKELTTAYGRCSVACL